MSQQRQTRGPSDATGDRVSSGAGGLRSRVDLCPVGGTQHKHSVRSFGDLARGGGLRHRCPQARYHYGRDLGGYAHRRARGVPRVYTGRRAHY